MQHREDAVPFHAKIWPCSRCDCLLPAQHSSSQNLLHQENSRRAGANMVKTDLADFKLLVSQPWAPCISRSAAEDLLGCRHLLTVPGRQMNQLAYSVAGYSTRT